MADFWGFIDHEGFQWVLGRKTRSPSRGVPCTRVEGGEPSTIRAVRVFVK